ncbi:MAG: hypothetical protein JO108_11150 [Acidobacteriaceae bacterium]|nr:hypothetical protein [Acidobacteriaceae bacterium]
MTNFKRSTIFAAAVGFVTLMTGHNAEAATIKTETLAAWDQRIAESETKVIAERADPERFVSAAHGKAAKAQLLNAAEGPAIWGGMSAVPSGLIHHWTGVVFVRDAHARDLVRVLQDYDAYSDIFKPAVVESNLVGQTSSSFRYRLKFVEKGFHVKAGLAGDFRTDYFRLDDETGYTITQAERLVELQNPATANEKELLFDASHGYVERMFTIVRYHETAGGLSVELESIVLSRNIPAAVRWMVAPLVERFSRQTLSSTIKSLSEAVEHSRALESAASTR